MNNQANKLRSLMNQNGGKKSQNTHFIAITSGKGGVGKSTISAIWQMYLLIMDIK